MFVRSLNFSLSEIHSHYLYAGTHKFWTCANASANTRDINQQPTLHRTILVLQKYANESPLFWNGRSKNYDSEDYTGWQWTEIERVFISHGKCQHQWRLLPTTDVNGKYRYELKESERYIYLSICISFFLCNAVCRSLHA